MCGIAGILNFSERPVELDQLSAMTNRMIERGPDDDGFYLEGNVGLGFRRLSIIDVAGGHQPLTNETEDLHLVLNGEIYNYRELRETLIGRGHVFKTGSDAEVVLHLYEEMGPEALAQLNGMFAFALYDSRRRALWIARDRLGIKPLFYALSEEKIVFASDIRALRALCPTTVDPQQVLKYVVLSYAPATETVWTGIRKLAPAHYLWIEGPNVVVQRYWDIGSIGAWHGKAELAQDQLQWLLKDSIKLQLRSDVPLGVFLSGGLDSSTIVALGAEQLEEPLRTFTIRFEGKNSSDERFAREIAQRYSTSHVEMPMGRLQALTAMDELLPKLDEPLSDSALLPAYWLSKAAREQGIKVLLNGAGGDEIFGGYPRHWPAKFGSPTWVAETIPDSLRHIVAWGWSLFQPYRAIRAKEPVFAWSASVSGVNLAVLRLLLRDPQDFARVEAVLRDEHTGLCNPSPTPGYTYNRMSLDVHKYLPDDVLALTDKATMAASVEGRVPLLDHRLVEFAFSLPADMNFLNGKPKGLLKRVMSSRLPEQMMTRQKEGFNAPMAVWLGQDRGADFADELLNRRTPVLEELMNPIALKSVLASPKLRSQSASTLFALFLFNRWHRSQLAW